MNIHIYIIYLHVYIYIHIIYIINKYVNINIAYFSEIYTCMCVYLYIHNKNTQNTHILCNKNFFLYAINHDIV